MSTINKVRTDPSTTHTFKDDVSGFGIFSAAQGLASAGHTKVATLSYQTFNTTTAAFDATTNVDFYSNSGSSSGNEWEAAVDDTNLILRRNGWIMPDFSTRMEVAAILEALTSASILTKSGSNYSPAGNFNVSIGYYASSGSKPRTLLITPTTPQAAPASLARASTQSPAAGTVIPSNNTETITITQT